VPQFSALKWIAGESAIHRSLSTNRDPYCPVPVSEVRVWAGVAPPPTLTFNDAVLVVLVVGLNVKLTVQLAPTASVDGNGLNGFAPQLFVCAKRFAPVPVIAMFVIGRGMVPVLVSVTVCEALVVLIA